MLAGVLTLCLAGLAAAAWMPAVDVSDVGDFAGLPDVAVDASGNTIAVWRGFDGTNYRARAAIRPAGGSFGAVQTLSDPGGDVGGPFSGPRIALDRKGNAIAFWYRFDGTNDRIEVAVRPAGGTFGTAQTISDAGTDARFPDVAIDRRGNAIAVWTQSDGFNDRIRAAVRRRGAAFDAAQTISDSSGNATVPEVGVDRKGNAVVVWERTLMAFPGVTHTIQAASRPVRGTFGTEQSISGPGEDSYEPQLAVDRHGNAIAVWTAYVSTTYRIRAAFQPAGGVFGTGQLLSAAAGDAGLPQLAIDKAGNAIAVWRHSDGVNDRIQAAVRPANGAFATADTLSDAGGDAELPEIAFDKIGNAIAIWLGGNGPNAQIQAASRPAGGSFGLAETLSAPDGDGSFPELTFDRRGNATAVWSFYDGVTSKIQASVDTP
jgi:hypothetical protein